MASSKVPKTLPSSVTTSLENMTSSVTRVNIVKVSHMWTIENFSSCCEETGKFLESSIFSSHAKDKSQWRLHLYPRGTENECKDYVSLFLYLVSCQNSEVAAKFKFSVQHAANGKLTNVMEIKQMHSFQYASDQEQSRDFGFKKFVRRDHLAKEANYLLPEDRLTIACELCIRGAIVNVSCQSPIVPPDCRLAEDLDALFEAPSFCDVTLCVGGREFPAHKAILGARSEVFRAMFEHEMEESRENRVEISDIDPEVFREMLRFMYSGRAPDLQSTCHRLLAAADKYALDRLKVMCESALYAEVTVDTVSELLVLADLHNAGQLKTCVIDFIHNHLAAVRDTTGWKSMVDNHPLLVADVFRAENSL